MFSVLLKCAAAALSIHNSQAFDFGHNVEVQRDPACIDWGHTKVQSPLMKHIMFFAKDGKLSFDSIIAAHRGLGFDENLRLKFKALAILNLAKKGNGKNDDELIEAVSEFAKQLEGTHNPASAGIWQPGGQINYEMLEAISEKAIEIDGKMVITRQIIDDHLSAYQSYAGGAYSVSTWVYDWFPLQWWMITKGSFDELFEYFGDIEGRPDAISLERFQQFYEANDEVLATLAHSRQEAQEQRD